MVSPRLVAHNTPKPWLAFSGRVYQYPGHYLGLLSSWLGYVFCALHRLPEQHSCIYDHKEGGRKEALKNMVPASKKIGRSFHRIDSRPE